MFRQKIFPNTNLNKICSFTRIKKSNLSTISTLSRITYPLQLYKLNTSVGLSTLSSSSTISFISLSSSSLSQYSTRPKHLQFSTLTNPPIIATSLQEAYTKRTTLTQLDLSSSSDLKCINLMCEKLNTGCACRLALSLERLLGIEKINIANNSLTILPDSLWKNNFHNSIQIIECNNNLLTSLSIPSIDALSNIPNFHPTSLPGRKHDESTFLSAAVELHPYPVLHTLNFSNNQLTYTALLPLLNLIERGYFPSLKYLLLDKNPIIKDPLWLSHSLYKRYSM